MGPQRKEGIYVGCESSNIIRDLDPPTINILLGRFVDCLFNEEKIPCLVGQSNPYRDINFNDIFTPNMFPNSRIQECEREVQRILDLNQLVDRLPDSFNNIANVTKSHIHASTHLERPTVQTTHMKRSHGKDLQPCKRRIQGEVCAARGDVLFNIELDNSERKSTG